VNKVVATRNRSRFLGIKRARVSGAPTVEETPCLETEQIVYLEDVGFV